MELIKKDEDIKCRTCLKSGAEGVSLYNACVDKMEMNMKYSEMLASSTGIYAWEGDGFPNMICTLCTSLLFQCWEFSSLCKTSDSFLRGYVPTDRKMKVEQLNDDDDCKDEMIQENGEEEYKSDDSQSIIEQKNCLKAKRNKTENKVEWKCVECDVIRETECKLKKHYKKEHPHYEYTYPCNECKKAFKKRKDLQVHLRIHNGERPYTCEWCGASFTQWGTLHQHKYIHTGERPYCCTEPKCQGRFTTMSSLRRHIRSHTGEHRHVCEVCGRKFINIASLYSHRLVHSAQRPHKCSTCERSFKSTKDLRTHQLIHGSRSYVCEDCGKEFSVRWNLNKHRKKMHSEGAGTCTVCHKATSDLKEHASVHSEELNYKCKVCDRRFRHKGILNAHMVLHKNASKYKCPAEGCPKAFYRKNLMEFHFNKLHINKTPHHCDHCPQGFYRISDLTRHINTFHPSQTKPILESNDI